MQQKPMESKDRVLNAKTKEVLNLPTETSNDI
jgi:hypothetical protein